MKCVKKENAMPKFSQVYSEFRKNIGPDLGKLENNRIGRNEFVANELILDNLSILNIGGGGKRHLQTALKRCGKSNASVFEIDITGDCDLVLNLDKVKRIDFEDGKFDVVCAFDVLEHLEQFHLINEEIFRLSRKECLISLPISSTEFFPSLFGISRKPDGNRNETGVYSKFYGLPKNHPDDRHRWFLYFDDIVEFYLNFAEVKNCKVTFYTPLIQKSIGKVSKALIIGIFGKRFFYNFVQKAIFIKLSKT